MTHSDTPTNNHAPSWKTSKERSNTFALRLIVWIALTLGRPTARLFLYPICIYFLFFARSARAASKNYLHRVLDHKPHINDGFRHIHTFASTILDRVFFLNDAHQQFTIEAHLDELAKNLIETDSGCILLGAHLGSFEVTRAYANIINGPAAHILMYEENAQKLNAILKAINPSLTQQIIGLGKIDSMLKVEQALTRGEFVGILADRGLEQNKEDPTFDFLGQPAHFPAGPMRIAAMLNAPVLLMVGLYRGGNHYELHFEKLADFRNLDRAQRKALLTQAQTLYVQRIEHYCRIAPYNWFNFYNFWDA